MACLLVSVTSNVSTSGRYTCRHGASLLLQCCAALPVYVACIASTTPASTGAFPRLAATDVWEQPAGLGFFKDACKAWDALLTVANQMSRGAILEETSMREMSSACYVHRPNIHVITSRMGRVGDPGGGALEQGHPQ